MPTKKEFEDALRKVQRNQMTHTRSSTQDTDYELARKRFLPNLAQGSAAGFLGTPVDLVNLLTNVKKPVMGSEWIGEKLNADIDSPAFAVGQLLDPTGPVNAATAIAPALGGIIKAAKGAHWFPGKPDTISDAMQMLGSHRFNNADEHIEELDRAYEGGRRVHRITPELEAEIREYDFPRNQAINNFADNQLAKYVRQRLGTENDEIRKLAERQPIHTNLEPVNDYTLGRIASNRAHFGFPPEGIAQSETAKNWENLVDNSLNVNEVKDYLPYDGLVNLEVYSQLKNPTFTNDPVIRGLLKAVDEGTLSRDNLLEQYKNKVIDSQPDEMGMIPRLALANPKTPMYNVNDELTYNLGFDHLVDELGNMLDIKHLPENWPKDLVLTPEQVETMSVEDMVKKVAKVNQHRAKMAKVAERKSNERLASLPELARSESGYRLVEHGDTSDKNAQDLVRMCGEKNEWCTQGEGLSREYGSGNNRLVNILDPDNKPIYQATVTTKTRNPLAEVSPEDIDAVDEYVQREFQGRIPFDQYNDLLRQTPSARAAINNPSTKMITEFKGYRNSTETPPEEQRQMFINWMKENNIQPNLGVANQLGMSKDPITDLYMDNQELINEIYRNDDFMNFMIDRNRNPPDMDDFELISDYHAWWAGYDPDRI